MKIWHKCTLAVTYQFPYIMSEMPYPLELNQTDGLFGLVHMANTINCAGNIYSRIRIHSSHTMVF